MEEGESLQEMVVEHWTARGQKRKKTFDINPGPSAWRKILKRDSKSMIHRGKNMLN